MNQNPSLAGRLRAASHDLHRIAEQSGIMRRLLRGQVGRPEYALLLRNFHALYDSLEAALDHQAHAPELAPLRIPALYRTAALADDLDYFHGTGWQSLALSPAMRAYVARIQEISDTRPALLAAHAYVRYLGDLSGGQMLAGVIRRSLDLPAHEGAAFYAFGDSAQATALKEQFRAALDGLPVDEVTAGAIAKEASSAFERHIALFIEMELPEPAAGQSSLPPPAA